MRRLLTPNGRLVAGIAGFCLLAATLLWVRVSRQLTKERHETIKAAVQRNANLAVALEQYAVRTINNADAVLQLVRMAYEKSGGRIDLDRLLADYVMEKDFAASVSIADESGRVKVSSLSVWANPTVNVTDRPHFRYHRLHPNGGLYIGEPLQSRLLGKAAVPLSRRLTRADGSFAGVVTVLIEPATFTRFYANAAMAPHDVLSLVSTAGVTYSRRTGGVNSHGDSVVNHPLLDYVNRSSVGNYHASDALRGIPAFFSYRKLAGYPIVATAGTAETDVLADYRKRAAKDYTEAAFMTLFGVAFSVVLMVSLRSRKRHLNRVWESEMKYRSVFENSLDAIVITSLAGKIVAVNKAAGAFLGYTQEGLLSRSAAELVDATDPVFKRLALRAKTQGTSKGELRFLRSNGLPVVGEVASAHYTDAKGKERFIVIIRDSTQRIALQRKLAAEQKRHQRQTTEEVIRAQEREREAIGRELHDNVNQVLTTVKLYLETAKLYPETRDEMIPKSMQLVQESVNEIRGLSHALTAPTLGTRSLVDSLSALAEAVQSASGLAVYFEHNNFDNHLSMDQNLALYRIAQEQLTNVIKHAGATEAVVSLLQTKGQTVLSVQDNGQGFDTRAQRAGIGLNNIVSRVKVFDCEMAIQSATGRGCLLEVRIPRKAAVVEETIVIKN